MTGRIPLEADIHIGIRVEGQNPNKMKELNLIGHEINGL